MFIFNTLNLKVEIVKSFFETLTTYGKLITLLFSSLNFSVVILKN